MPTVRELVDRTTTSLDALASRGQAVEDEWLYVTDLQAAWAARLAEVAAGRGSSTVEPSVSAAVALAINEAARIEDPHRAIDWLSTLPQIVLLALDEAS